MVAMWEVSGSVSGAVGGVGGAVVIPLKFVVKAMWSYTTSRHDIVSEIGSSTRREGSSKSSGATED